MYTVEEIIERFIEGVLKPGIMADDDVYLSPANGIPHQVNSGSWATAASGTPTITSTPF